MTDTPTPLTAMREALAALEHDQWMAWSQSIATSETLSPERLSRWAAMWVPYDDLDEATKEIDREWADKALAITRHVRETGCEGLREALLDIAIAADGWEPTDRRDILLSRSIERARAALASPEAPASGGPMPSAPLGVPDESGCAVAVPKPLSPGEVRTANDIMRALGAPIPEASDD